MTTYQIRLNSIDKVKSFVNAISKTEDDYEIVSGSNSVNAKSILAIFTLDLSKPLKLRSGKSTLPNDVQKFLA